MEHFLQCTVLCSVVLFSAFHFDVDRQSTDLISASHIEFFHVSIYNWILYLFHYINMQMRKQITKIFVRLIWLVFRFGVKD